MGRQLLTVVVLFCHLSDQCTLALGGLRSAMESWETVGGGKKTTKAAGRGHGPSPSGGVLGDVNRGQGE